MDFCTFFDILIKGLKVFVQKLFVCMVIITSPKYIYLQICNAIYIDIYISMKGYALKKGRILNHLCMKFPKMIWTFFI